MQDLSVESFGRSFKQFKVDDFISETAEPFFNVLMEEIKTAFKIAEYLKGFTIFDCQAFPWDADLLNNYGVTSFENGTPVPWKISGEPLKVQFDAYKTFVFKQILEFETQHSISLAFAKKQLEGEIKGKENLKNVSKRKVLKMEKNIKL